MAPARTANRRGTRGQDAVAQQPAAPVHDDAPCDPVNDVFLDPMMGTALQIYVEKDVENRDTIVDLITRHGGTVSPGYSGVQYVLVDPHKESGQNLYRQYAGKKGKLVLNANWVIECVNSGVLQTYQTNWAGCKVTGQEPLVSTPQQAPVPVNTVPSAEAQLPPAPIITEEMVQQLPQPPPNPQILQQQAQQAHPAPPPPISAAATDPLAHHAHPPYSYPVYANPMDVTQRAIHPPIAAPPQTWQGANGIAPSQTHMQPPPPPPPPHMLGQDPYRPPENPWNGAYAQPPPPPHPGAMAGVPPPEYDYRYREDQRAWAPPEGYYPPPYEQPYAEPDAYMDEAGPSNPTPGNSAEDPGGDKPRGRKRVRTQPPPAPPASTLVANRRNPPARSPTPPTRVIKSTYGGNLFTADDIEYLRKYIEYCQEQGLVLSLREICERIAVKAPHHTFYSWRRYCNKHQIRLGGYAMEVPEGSGPGQDDDGVDDAQVMESAQQLPASGTSASAIAAAQRAVAADANRTRSPTPPRALFRSTTGKGVAFTDEDVTFLVRFLEYRNRTQNGKVDMVNFWKDVAAKAPHHSRASWMKFYRRHKHELHHTSEDAPLPTPPEKKMRYSQMDDVLLARFFVNKPEGTSDKVFQAFARVHPHHPWKGWQEHHRIHKAKIDHLIHRLANGENIDVAAEE